jgi:P4 family phage/plasmid primase-like protien
VVNWALKYASYGWPVLPLHTAIKRGDVWVCSCQHLEKCASPGKHPRSHQSLFPNGVLSATTDPDLIKKLWSKWPQANIGVATGLKSFDAIDVDLPEGPDTLRDLEMIHGDIPHTMEQITGSGGRQIFFKPTGKLTNKVKFADGLDIRSDGGYVVVPPSRHVSGNRYDWEASSHPGVASLADMPQWIVDLVAQSGTDDQCSGSSEKLNPSEILNGIPEGKRDSVLFKYACRLRSLRMAEEEARQLIFIAAKNCTPPFPLDEALKKIESAWKYRPGSPVKNEPQKLSRQELINRINGTDDFDELTTTVLLEIDASGLPESHIVNLLKLISKKTKTPLLALKKDLKSLKSESPSGEFLHLPAARQVIDHFGKENLIGTNPHVWRWNGVGVWKHIDDRTIKQTIHEISGNQDITRYAVDSVLDLFKTEVFKPNHRFDPQLHLINLKNGELHYQKDEWKLLPHQRDNYLTTQLPVEYKPKTESPRFLQFLEEVFLDDADKDHKIKLVLEAIGYSLLTSCQYEKFFMLIGRGANGKSVLMDTISSLVGPEHVTAVQPSQFDNRFQRAHLQGKLVNLVTEIAEGHEIADAQLKAITSGELTTAEHKHKAPFEFRPFATCWFGTNHMPHTRDFSDALFRRATIITFNRTFTEEEQDQVLKDKLKTELSGILNLATNAMARVFRDGSFTKPFTSELAKEEWRVNCDQVAQFIEDHCRLGPGEKVYSSHLYNKYEEWTKRAGIRRILNRKNFTTRLLRYGVELKKGTAGIRELSGIDISE